MQRQFIMVSSITYAMKAKAILKDYGIYADIIKTPKYSHNARCSYSLIIYRNADKAIALLNKNNIEILGITQEEGL
ncbi:MAG: DUF3343 domain-containing protein [Acutalibacteraceae bacterium]|nr:DUF3343 domain-containing protein [Acutalibacteraceae bacterium]